MQLKSSQHDKKNLKTLRSVGPSGLPRAALDKQEQHEQEYKDVEARARA